MTAQLKDSSRSTTHNIAEGFGRANAMDNARFCKVARGSLAEALDQLITCSDEGLISSEELARGRELFTDARAWLDGYIDYLTKGRTNNMLRESTVGYGERDDIDQSAFQPSTLPTFNPQPAEQ